MYWLRLAVIAVAVLLCAATSPPRYSYPRNYPAWQVVGVGSRIAACAEVALWVSKSGKEGAGVTVRLLGRGERACRVEVTAADLEVGRMVVQAAALPEPFTVEPAATRFVYLPFAFDNEAAWNRGERSGWLSVALAFDGVPSPKLRVELEHRRGGPHRVVDRYRHEPAPPPAPAAEPVPMQPASPPAAPGQGGGQP